MGKGRRRSRGSSDVDTGEVVEIPPVDVDGVRTVAVLTVIWAVGFVILAFRKDSLDASGQGWWLWTCLAGVGLGLLGLEYTRKRRDAIEFAALRAEADDDESPAALDPAAAAEYSQPAEDHLGGGLPVVSPGLTSPGQGSPSQGLPAAVTRPINTPGVSFEPGESRRLPAGPPLPQDHAEDRSSWDTPSQPAAGDRHMSAEPPGFAGPPELPEQPVALPEQPVAPPEQPVAPPEQPVAPPEQPVAPPVWSAEPSDLLGEMPARVDSSWPAEDDEPLLETTLGGGRRARHDELSEEIDEITEGGGDQYRGRRARRSDSA